MKTAVAESVDKENPTEQLTKNHLKPTTMKTMKDFAAQQLSKKQMNDVRGGTAPQIIVEELQYCRFYKDGEYIGDNYVLGDMTQLLKEAADQQIVVHCTSDFE